MILILIQIYFFTFPAFYLSSQLQSFFKFFLFIEIENLVVHCFVDTNDTIFDIQFWFNSTINIVSFSWFRCRLVFVAILHLRNDPRAMGSMLWLLQHHPGTGSPMRPIRICGASSDPISCKKWRTNIRAMKSMLFRNDWIGLHSIYLRTAEMVSLFLNLRNISV